jgi:hypothetical protein
MNFVMKKIFIQVLLFLLAGLQPLLWFSIYAKAAPWAEVRGMETGLFLSTVLCAAITTVCLIMGAVGVFNKPE